MFCSRKKKRSWYRLALGALLFCLVLFVAARFFLSTAAKLNASGEKDSQDGQNLFV